VACRFKKLKQLKMGSLSAGLGFSQCPELGQCVIVPAVVLVQGKEQDCKMGARGRVG